MEKKHWNFLLKEELSWKIYIISLTVKAQITTTCVCYVISQNGLEAFWSNHFYRHQTVPVGATWSIPDLCTFTYFGYALFAFIMT